MCIQYCEALDLNHTTFLNQLNIVHNIVNYLKEGKNDIDILLQTFIEMICKIGLEHILELIY